MASFKTLFFVLAALVAVAFAADEDKNTEKRGIPLGYGYSGLGYAGLGYSGAGFGYARSAYSGYPYGYTGYNGYSAYPYAGAYHGAYHGAYPYAGYGYY